MKDSAIEKILTHEKCAKIYVISSALCLIIAWNYWIPTYLYSPSVLRYGSGSPDFGIFYTAGYALLTHTKLPPLFIYPPASLPFYAFFALFNIEQAGELWMATYLITFLIAMLSLAFTLEDVRRAFFISLTGVLFFTSYPLLIMMNLGQVDLLVASLSVLSLTLQRLKHDNASAIFLSFATLLKGPPILLLVYFVLYRKDIRYLARFCVATLATVAASMLVVPWQLFIDYFGIATQVTVTPSTIILNQSLLSYTSSLSSIVVVIVGLLAFSIFTFKIASKDFSKTKANALSDDGMFLLNVLVLLLLSPRIWPGTYVWIILPVALFLSGLLVEKVRLFYLVIICFGAFLLNASLSQIFLQFSDYSILPLAISGNTLLTIVLFLTLFRPSIVK